MTTQEDFRRASVATMLRARSIAVIGASGKTGTFGHNVVSHLIETGYGGQIHPVNPRYDEIEGLPCYAEIDRIPAPVDCAILAVADNRLEVALEAAAASGARSAVIFGTAIEEAPVGPTPLTDRLAAIARSAGMAMCGGNCMGFLNLVDNVMVGGWPYRPPPKRGHIGLITHSGSSYSGFALSGRQLRMSHMISSGQELATSAADYLEFLLTDDETRVVGCILETMRDPERFLAALDAADRKGVPVVILKLGRSEHGKAMARAHSGALAGSDAAYRAVFERYNVVGVESLDEMVNTLELFACGRAPTTDRIALMTDSGGERTMIVDLAADLGLDWADLSEATTKILADTLDAGLAPVNPLDVWGTGHEHERIAVTCFQALADDPQVGQLVFASNMPSGRALLHAWGRVAESVHRASDKPVMMLGNISTAFDREEARRLREVGLPVLLGTVAGLQAIRATIEWRRGRRERAEAGAAPLVSHAVASPEVVARWRARLASAAGPLDTAESLALVADFGLPTAGARIVETEADLHAALGALRYPLAMKTLAAGIDHKFDAGGVVLGVDGELAALTAWRDLAGRLGPRVLVQEMAAPGVEIFMGMTVDPEFGPLVTVGLGGIFVEVMKDVVTFLPPVNAAQAVAYLKRLKGFPLLDGARGRPRVDLAALGAAIAAFAAMGCALGDSVAELDVNPIIAGAQGAVAVDALVVPKAREEP